MYQIFKNEEKTQVLESPKAYLRFKNEEIELVELCFEENEEIPMHKNPLKVVFYVIEGEGVLKIGDSINNLSAGDIIEIHPDEDRSWKNPHKENLKVLVTKFLE